MQQYLDLMRRVRDTGVRKEDRTGTGTLSVFGHQMRFDLADGFPMVTTKKLHLKSIIHELIWFLGGDTSLDYLKKHGVTIWDEWAREVQMEPSRLDDLGIDYDAILEARKGTGEPTTCLELGPVYGKQWRRWAVPDKKDESGNFVPQPPIDQIDELIETLKCDPDSRRMIVSAWNPADIPDMALAPCHCLFQFYVADGRLSCQLYQRSADIFLGVPFNIASYALLTLMVAQVTGLKPGEFVHTFGDAHLYLNHLEQAKEQLSRTPRPLPQMKLNPAVNSIFGFRYDDFELTGYDPYPHIKAPVAV